MELIAIEKKEWLEVIARLVRIESLLREKSENGYREQKLWVPLAEFLKHSTISRASWYREYQHKIKHRNDGIKIWVNIPSFEAYLEDKAINKRAA